MTVHLGYGDSSLNSLYLPVDNESARSTHGLGCWTRAKKGTDPYYSHFKVTLNGKRTIFPDHGGKEIGTGLVAKIKKDLGLK